MLARQCTRVSDFCSVQEDSLASNSCVQATLHSYTAILLHVHKNWTLVRILRPYNTGIWRDHGRYKLVPAKLRHGRSGRFSASQRQNPRDVHVVATRCSARGARRDSDVLPGALAAMSSVFRQRAARPSIFPARGAARGAEDARNGL